MNTKILISLDNLENTQEKIEIGTIFNIALCSNDMDLSIEHLNAALTHIKKNIRASIILICLAFTKNSSQIEDTEFFIGDLLKQGMSVISAFDNRGVVSFLQRLET